MIMRRRIKCVDKTDLKQSCDDFFQIRLLNKDKVNQGYCMGKKQRKRLIQMKPAFGKHFVVSPQSKFTHCNHFNLNLNDGDVLPTV